MLTKLITKAFAPQQAFGFSTLHKIIQIQGQPKNVSDTKHVALRGTYIKGNFNDLPNLIFFPEVCDVPNNWIQFFTNRDHGILNYRNVYILNPRNFGTSDRHPSYDLEEMAGDVVRFMYDQKISTATLAGHGFGGKLALAVGCYHAERTTGVVALDTSPLDHRYHEAHQEFAQYIQKLSEINLGKPRAEIENILRTVIPDPKWRALFNQNLRRVSERSFGWDFDLPSLLHNVKFNKADSIAYWAERHGLYTGRVRFIFPEYSRWVHLATNTLPMMKVAVNCHGLGRDIFAIQGDENPLNHWIYDHDDIAFPVAKKFQQFLRLYDGVHTLLYDRTEIGTNFIPDRPNSRNDSAHVYGDYSPAHLHHNWRFSDIYEEAKKYEADPNYKGSK